MSRQLPPTITADKSPDWLPAGWIAQSTVLRRGRVVRSYTQLKTGKKFFTKDNVLHYIEMEKVREERYSNHMLGRNKDLGLQPENWITEEETCNKDADMQRTYEIHTDLPNSSRYLSKVEVFRHLAGLECEASAKPWEKAGIDEYNNACQRMITYPEEHGDFPKNQEEPEASSSSPLLRGNKDLECLPENWVVEEGTCNKDADLQSTYKRPSWQPKGQKLKSPATRQRLFVDDDIYLEGKGAADEDKDQRDSSEGLQAISLAEEDLYDVVVSADQTLENLDLIASSGFGVKVCEPVMVSTPFDLDISPKKDLTESGMDDKGSSLTCRSDLVKDEVTEQSENKSKEPFKMQDLHEEQPRLEETINRSRKLLFFPFRDASSDAQHLLSSSVTPVTLSAEDLVNCDVGTSSLADIMQDQNIHGNKKQKKTNITYSSQRIKKNNPGTSHCSTEQLERSINPKSKRTDRNARKKSCIDTATDQNESLTPKPSRGSEAYQEAGSSVLEGSSRNRERTVRQQSDNWPEPCPYFAFESLTGSLPIKTEDSVIRRYLEQHSTAKFTDECNTLLPDFGLPSFSQFELFPNEADEQHAIVNNSSPDPPWWQPVNPSLASCSFVGPIGGD